MSSIGLKRGLVILNDHNGEWDENAITTIKKLKEILGDVAVDIQHIGSTAIKSIKAKPIIDLVIGINSFDDFRKMIPVLEESGFIYRPNNDRDDYMLLVVGDFINDTRTHHIHVVPYNGEEWCNQIAFRDYLNLHIDVAKEYETLKIKLAEQYYDNRSAYTENKDAFIANVLLLTKSH